MTRMTKPPTTDNPDSKIPPALTIMVAEPDVLARMVLAEYLRDCGYNVIEAVSAEDVLAVLAADHKIDIVIAEVTLTGEVDGFTLAKEIRAAYQEVDVILTWGAANAAEKAGDLCEEGPLDKPYHPQELVRRINILRERRRASKR